MITKRMLSGNSCSLLGYGCMRFPTNPDGAVNEAEAFELLDMAYNAGVNYFDTAYPYHNGESEKLVGKWLKRHPRETVYLATKLPVWELSSEEDVLSIFNRQLEKLDVEYVDYYLLHSLRKDSWENSVLKFNVIPKLEELQRQGRIRNIGFSFHDSYDVFEEIITYRKWDFCQIQYNYMDTEFQAGDKGYALAEKLNIPLVIMEPIRGGALAGMSSDISERFAIMEPKKSLAAWALSWVATHDNVKVILSGMSNAAQVSENIATFSPFESLTAEQMNGVADIADYIRSKVKNKCTGCRYCVPCPFEVNIPRNFKCWNEFGMYGQTKGYKISDWTADKCRGCRACVSKCPQHINIPDDLKQMLSEML